MRKTFQILIWIASAYYIYKKMYPNGFTLLNESAQGDHKTDNVTKNSPAPNKPKNTKTKAKKRKQKKQKKQA